MKIIKVETCEKCPFVGYEGNIPYHCTVDPDVRARSYMLPMCCPLRHGDIQVSLTGTKP